MVVNPGWHAARSGGLMYLGRDVASRTWLGQP